MHERPVVENSDDYREMMSAHEAGHAALGSALGARVEAVYARILDRLPNGNFRVAYLTRLGRFRLRGLDERVQVLCLVAGTAGEILLRGVADDSNIHVDKADLLALGFQNFDYCCQIVVRLLEENRPLVVALRDRIKWSMSNLKNCKLAKNNTHIVLLGGSKIERLFRDMGFRTDPSALDVHVAKAARP